MSYSQNNTTAVYHTFSFSMATSTGSNMFEKQDAQRGHIVNIQDVDVAAGLDLDKPLDPDVAARIRYVHP